MVLAMLLGGQRSGEVRSLLLRDVDQGRRRTRVVGKGGCERVVPIDARSSPNLALTCDTNDRPGSPRRVLRRAPRPERRLPGDHAGLRSLFRRQRQASRSVRVRPHRLRNTYGTQLAAAGIDLLALRELMGHASPETTSRYVHLSVEHLAAEYAAARDTMDGAR